MLSLVSSRESLSDEVVLGTPDTASGFKFGSDQHVEKTETMGAFEITQEE